MDNVRIGRTKAGRSPSEMESTGSLPPVVAVENLSKTYRGDIRALREVSFSVRPGEVVGLLGPNGAGKTTCVKCILGLVEPTDGRVAVAGFDRHDQPRAVHRHVGAMLEGARNMYWRLTARENLQFFSSVAGRNPSALETRHEQLLERLGLAERADDPVKEFSRGMKQKVSLATVLARDVDVVFLDEPTLGLDVESSLELRRELETLVSEENIAIVLSSHDMNVVQDLCDRVVVLSDGRVVANDRVEALLDAFRTQTYAVRIRDPPESEIRSAVSDCCELVDHHRQRNRLRLEFNVRDERQLSRTVTKLAEADGRLETIETIEPDLEEVFLRMTDGGGS